jgi:hypothetical protein
VARGDGNAFLVPKDGDEAAVSQSGASAFPDLVWAHYRWERQRRSDQADQALEDAYRDQLKAFESKVGSLEEVYWSTRAASAVAMTVWREDDGRDGARRRTWSAWRRALRALRIHEPDQIARLHRVSDWATRESAGLADLLQECDLLAIKVAEVLRGTTELIALRWILGVQAHVLGFVERERGKHDDKAVRELVRSQRRNLAQIEGFYHRAASKSGRIVYATGMLIGLVVAGAIGAIAGVLLRVSGLWSEQHLIIVCFSAGALGALVSALSRIGNPESGRFNMDFELGRPLLRRLGFFRPFVGAVFGIALYFLLRSEILDIQFSPGAKPYYYGFAAFLAGFSERYTNVVFGTAERTLAPAGGTTGATSEATADGADEREDLRATLARMDADLAEFEARLR